MDQPTWDSGTDPFSLANDNRAVSSLSSRAEQAILTSRRTAGEDGWSEGSGFSDGFSGGGMGGGGGGTF